MSHFICEHCGAHIIDSPKGYLSGCRHYPMEHNTDSPDCWCYPDIEEIDGNMLVIHRDKTEAN